jgi:hypothetical protein
VTDRGDAMAVRGEPPVESGLVASRLETKYLVSRASVAELRARIGARLSSHHHSVPPGVLTSDARSQVTTTLYLDTPRRDLCRAATRGSVHLKVRARVYRDEPGSPGATPEPLVWMELKERDGLRSGKRRCALQLGEAMRWLSALGLHDEPASKAECEALLGSDPDRAALLGDLAQTRAALGAPLQPSCVVRYRREAFQDAAGLLRVTLDQDVRVYRAPAAPFAEVLGAPVHEEPVCVVEAKTLGAAPTWLSELLDAHGARALDYSKLVMASRAVHGPL